MLLKQSYLIRIMILIFICMLSCIQYVYGGQIILQDKKILVAFDSETGALVRMEDKSTNWMIERRAELGISFRLFVPMPNRRYNFVLGQQQKADKVEKISDNKIVIEWKNLKSEHAGILPITIDATVTLKDGVVTFDATVKNNSDLTIDYPYFGDLNPPSKNTSLSVRTMRYDNLKSDEIYPHFGNGKGYWGDFYPTKTFASSYSLFCLIQSSHEGLYIEMRNNPSYLLQYAFEQHPGVISNVTNMVSKQDSIEGKPLVDDGYAKTVQVHLNFRTCHFIYAHPHTTKKLAPVVVECYKGDWHSGVDLYKHWRATWYKEPSIPDWVKGVNTWQQLQINSPAEDYRVPYDSLVKYGRECAKNGVKAIQLVGWNKGGQDGGNPSMDTDPGLGTWQQLYNAIQKIQGMGVKIILFDKFPWADMTTEWYKTELYKYATLDPYGIPYQSGGDSYYTPTQLARINTHRFAIMDLLDSKYRNIAVHEFKKALALNASGFLYDEVCVQPPNRAYDFSNDHGYTPPGYIYSGAELLGKQLHDAADSASKNFLFCGEGPQDWLTQYYPLSYFRIGNSSTPVERYIDPQAPLMIAVSGFDDREAINFCLMDRYIIEYEPYDFKGELPDFPLTLTYGKKVDSLRRKYKQYLWDADFNDTIGAEVSANGSVRYSVFVTKTGKRAVVVVNMESKRTVSAKVSLPNQGKLIEATPENPDAHATEGRIQIPPRSAVVIMEE
jgi:Domain of unknown function (DUF6259)